MSLRSDFADAIGAGLPDDRIIDHAYALDGMDAHVPVIMLERTTITKAPNALGGYFAEFNLWCISPVIGRDTADDALDDLADRVIAAVDAVTWCTWDTCTRSVYIEQFPAYLIHVTVFGDRTKGLG
jgi:hypothetical protein